MATSYQRRPDGKAPEPKTLQKPDAALQAELDRVEARQKALEQRGEKGDAEMDAELAAKLQPAMGNAALAGLLNRGSETSTSGAGEAALEEKQKEDDKEEEGEEKEAGEVEHVLPSFSTSGGGGGGQPPWAMAREFGGDDDVVEDASTVDGPRWRPMPVLPDPDDEDAEIGEAEDDEADEEPDVLDLHGAHAALGDAPWRRTPLSRGLRHARNLARANFGPEALVDIDARDHALGRARAMLRFVAKHGEGLDGVLLARAAAAGEPMLTPAAGYSGAAARCLALIEVTLASLPPRWGTLLDIVADGRARARVENVAQAVSELGGLSSTALLQAVVGARVEPSEVELTLSAHPSALAALSLAARLDPLPTIDTWSPPSPPDPSDAVDAILARFTGAEAPEEGYGTDALGVVFERMNALLAALGGALVECAAAGVALAPYASLPAIVGVLEPTESAIRRAARRLFAAGTRLEGLVGTEDADGVRAVVAEAQAVRATVELARHGCLTTLAGLLLDHEPALPALPERYAEAEALAAAGRTELAKARLEEAVRGAPPELEPRLLLAAGALLTRVGLPEGGRLAEAAERVGEGLFGVGARSLAGGFALARGEWAAAERHGAAERRIAERHGLVYALADAAITEASARAAADLDWRAPLVEVGRILRERGEGGALNLLKGRWAELGG